MRSESAEFAWAVGLFEGEGCIASQRSSRILVMASTDLDVLTRFGEIVGFGHINGPYDRGHKPHWTWRSGTRTDVQAFLQAALPWLGARRRERAQEVLDFYEANPPRVHRSELCKAGLHPRTEENVQTTVENGAIRRRCLPCAQAASRRRRLEQVSA